MSDETVRIKEIVKRCYKIEMSRGASIKIDDSELPKVLQAVKTGNPCIVKQGIFNPSFYVSIIQDEDRQYEIRRYGKTTPLYNIFKGIEIKQLPNGFKKLAGGNIPKNE